MPYTPPSHNSPTASRPESPSLSRNHSYLKGQNHPGPNPPPPPSRPGLPRSTSSSSYLHRHRRSPSFSKVPSPGDAGHPTHHDGSVTFNADEKAIPAEDKAQFNLHGSLRQSPPPVNNALIPTGAMISPPESSHNSSDDEETNGERSRDLENLAELQAAISIIEQRREGSPDRQQHHGVANAEEAANSAGPLKLAVGTDGPTRSPETLRLPLSREARKISHSRSSTDSGMILDLPHHVESPVRTSTDSSESDDSEGNDRPLKPPMVRKKSGELVRPALRPAASKRRPSSMPGTPTYSKAVHFDSHLEHVRHFLQVDKPLAVSAGSSPVEAYESEIEFPFGYEEYPRSRSHPYEWEIRLVNFPSGVEPRQDKPVQIERVFLSSDNKNLVGTIAVQNVAFHKHVTTRFTLDYWKTTSEVVAEFNNDVRRKQTNDGLDRFNFSIKLADLANLENKTMFFCVRYNVNGQEYWDNNNSMNYQVDFSKQAKPQLGKHGMPGAASRPLNALPRSKPSPPTSSGARPKSMPVSFDDFSTGFDSFGTFDQSPANLIGDESSLKLKGPRARREIVPDAPARRNNHGAQAFGTRYDFAASLSAAISHASAAMGERSGLPQTEPNPESQQSYREAAARSGNTASSGPKSEAVQRPQHGDQSARPPQVPGTSSGSSKPAALVSEKPSLSSTSYQELVDKYCFFGSSKSSPQPSKATPGRMDGANDDASVSDVDVGSVQSSGHPSPASPPAAPRKEHVPVHRSPRASRSTSPASMRASSPVSFGYPYHQPMQNGFYPESHTPTAIQG